MNQEANDLRWELLRELIGNEAAEVNEKIQTVEDPLMETLYRTQLATFNYILGMMDVFEKEPTE